MHCGVAKIRRSFLNSVSNTITGNPLGIHFKIFENITDPMMSSWSETLQYLSLLNTADYFKKRPNPMLHLESRWLDVAQMYVAQNFIYITSCNIYSKLLMMVFGN